MQNNPDRPQQPPYGQDPYSQPPTQYAQPPSYGQTPYPSPPAQPPYGQDPYSQPPAAYAQQTPVPQPPPPYAQTPPVQAPMQPAPRKRRRWPLIVGIIIGLVLLVIIGGIAAIVLVVNNSPAKAAVQQYYAAMQSQDYTTAYSYMDPTMTLTIDNKQQQLNQQIFTQVAQAYDTDKGKVSSYSITSVNLKSSTSTGNTADIVVHVTRGNTPYDAHLQLQEQNGSWKIVSFDTL